MKFTDEVLAWWPSVARDLPWRRTRDPWSVLVSEIMLQQTQVDRVIPKWEAFLARFPTVEAAAHAPLGDLLDLWSGLGYNRRAKYLHDCAATVCAEFDGVFPESLAALQTLPGIGPYTARAVLAFAFERAVAVVDTNVGRVLARVEGRQLSAREVQAAADSLVPAGDAWRWNQALLDFGALICRKRGPACAECPVRRSCGWAGAGADPAVGSAAVSTPQSRFEGSDRQGRGRLINELRSGPIGASEAPVAMGWPDDPERAAKVIEGLLSDGLVVRTGAKLSLP